MIGDLLPASVVAVETRREADVALYPSEQRSIGRSVEARRIEFVTARACARDALKLLGLPPAPVPSGARGEPLWPDGVVGTITHCAGYRACAVARSDTVAGIGIDAEPHEPLKRGVFEAVASARERDRIGPLDSLRLDKVLFSAKESVFKVWYPLTRRPLDFDEVDVLIDGDSFLASLLVLGPVVHGRRLEVLHGRWAIEEGTVLTATTAGCG